MLERYSEATAGLGLGAYIQSEWEHCRREMERYCAFQAEIEICRSGRTTITVADENLEHENRPSLGDTDAERRRLAHRLAAQIFYFLRDIGHQHQHHDPSTDTIVDLFPFDGQDDLSWRHQVLYNIYRMIIQYKRNPRNKQFHASLGLLSYACTFQEICKKELGDPQGTRLPYFHAAGLEGSLRAIQAANQLETDDEARRRSLAQNFVLSVSAFAISVAALLQIADDSVGKIANPSSLLRWLGTIAVQHTEYVLGLVLALLVIASAIQRRAFRDWSWIRGTFRLVAAMPKSGSASVFAGLGVLFLVLLLLFLRIY